MREPSMAFVHLADRSKSRASRRSLAPWAYLCLLASATGCQSLTVPRDAGPPLVGADTAASKPTPRTIPVELIFARFDEHDTAFREELWNKVDEQAFDETVRRRLAANGLRVGIVTGDLPPHLAERILPDRAAPPVASDMVAAESPLTHRLLRLLPGRRSEVIAATGVEDLVLLETGDGQVSGGTYRDATGLFELKVRPAADGRVRIDLVPEIKHGPLERSWVGEDGMFRMEAGQRRHRRDDLALGVELREGALLLVGCAGEQGATLGDALLRDHGGNRSTMRLLAIRPLGPAVDPMFATATSTADGDDSDVLEIR
jgi:hypothetical protein